jgi:glycosyltransferase involved in cell wall biosynthesis
VEYLIKALPEVIEKHSGANLVVVGSGPCKRDLVGVTERLDLQSKVTFVNAVSQEELVRYYSEARVFVLPSIVNDQGETEGLGLVLLEAMASGVPVIGTGVGGIPDIIKNGETGLLAHQRNPHDLAEKILRLLDDEALRRKLAEKGADFVMKEFSWTVVAEKFKTIYEEASQENQRPRSASSKASDDCSHVVCSP